MMGEMECERTAYCLQKIDISRFVIRQHKRFDEIEHRALNCKSGLKCIEVSFSAAFNCDVLVTHFELQLAQADIFAAAFDICDGQASSISNRGHFLPMLSIKRHVKSPDLSKVYVDAIAFTQSVRFSLLLKKQFTTLFAEQINFRRDKGKAAQQQNVAKMLNASLKSMSICGLLPNIGPSASELTSLLNISQTLRKAGRSDESIQTDLLVVMSLINARRFVQASELLRNISKFFVQKYLNSKSNMQFVRIDRSWIRDADAEQPDLSSITRSYSAGRVLQSGKFLCRAAKIELLLAETINHPSLINEKMEAYIRANAYFKGNISPQRLLPQWDLEEVAYKIGPNIIPLLLKVMGDKVQILQVTALKSIQFFYETLGCTLANLIPDILNSIIASYPSLKPHEQPIGARLNIEESAQQRPGVKSKIIIDHYHHLLETLLSNIALVNKKYLRVIFNEIILTKITIHYLRNQLQLYLLRFGQKIISLCGPDLQVSVDFIVYIINLCQGEAAGSDGRQSTNKHILHNLVYFSQKSLDLLKTKVLCKYDQPAVAPICEWINNSLMTFCENEVLPSGSFVLNQILDFVIAVYQRKLKTKVVCPIQPLMYLLNLSLHNPRLPFERILQALVLLIQFLQGSLKEDIAHEIVERVMKKSKLSTLSVKQLKILDKILACVDNIGGDWLVLFLDCIPHSNFDETYLVFDTLLRKGNRNLSKAVTRGIVQTLLDQYTVKGKAHQQSKEHLIQYISLHSANLLNIINICVFQNNEPDPQHYYARKKRQHQHTFDSKKFRVDYELFTEKLNLITLVLSKCEVHSEQLIDVMSEDLVRKLYINVKKLVDSSNFKLKSRTLNLLKHLILLVSQLVLPSTHLFLLFAKGILHILRNFLLHQKDSKLHYYSLFNIGLLFQKMSKTHSNHLNDVFEEKKFEFMNSEPDAQFNAPELTQWDLATLRHLEFIKLWPYLMGLLNSPWESVRQMLVLVLLHFFSANLTTYHGRVCERLMQTIRPGMLNLLNSNEHSQRLGGIRLLCCLLGLGSQFNKKQDISRALAITSRNITLFIELIFTMQEDWDQGIAELAQLICRLCISPSQQDVLKKKISLKNFQGNSDNSFFSRNVEESKMDQRHSSFTTSNFDNLEDLLQNAERDEDQVGQISQGFAPTINQEVEIAMIQFRSMLEQNSFLNLENNGQKQSFAEEQPFFEANEDRQSDQKKDQKSEQEQLQFQDLGIIELDDEEWDEEQSEIRITQKLPFKKIYKLSPNIGSSAKHQRIRSKRYHQTDYDIHDTIIIDELQGKIDNENHVPKFEERSSPPKNVKESLPQKQLESKSSSQENISEKEQIEQVPNKHDTPSKGEKDNKGVGVKRQEAFNKYETANKEQQDCRDNAKREQRIPVSPGYGKSLLKKQKKSAKKKKQSIMK